MVQGRIAARGIAVSLGVALAIAALSSTSHARDPLDLLNLGTGTEVEGVARMGDRQIPLPAGKWELVLAETDRRGSVKSGTAFLVQKVDGKFAGYLFVRTNLEHGSTSGWKRPRWCDRTNVHYAESDNYYNIQDADCWFVNHRIVSNKVLRWDFLNRMKDYLRKHGAASTAVGNRFWRNDAYDFLLVAHFVYPAAFGFPPERGTRWVESKWHKNAVDGTPRRAFVDAVKAFGETYREAVRNGFRGRPGAGASNLKFEFQR